MTVNAHQHNGQHGADTVRPYTVHEPDPGTPGTPPGTPVSLGKLPADVDLIEAELSDDGELFAPEAPATEPVDPPEPEPGDWLAERRGRHAEAPRVFPAWLRDRDQFTGTAEFLARYYGREAAFHAVRAPVYVGRLWSGAPRGAVRLGGRWVRWVTDAEARPVEAKAAASDPDTWNRFVATQTRRTSPRRRTSLVVAVPVALLVTLAAILLHGWTLTVCGALALSALG